MSVFHEEFRRIEFEKGRRVGAIEELQIIHSFVIEILNGEYTDIEAFYWLEEIQKKIEERLKMLQGEVKKK